MDERRPSGRRTLDRMWKAISPSSAEPAALSRYAAAHLTRKGYRRAGQSSRDTTGRGGVFFLAMLTFNRKSLETEPAAVDVLEH
jgi:hypothetical protein